MGVKRSFGEWVLIVMVVLISVGINLPESLLEQWGINPNYLLIGLVATVALALLQYPRFALFLVIVTLTAGANLPVDMAARLGVSPTAMLAALVVMVILSLFNYMLKILPTGMDNKSLHSSSEGTKALFSAIEKGNAKMVQRILEMGVDVNQHGEDGTTPLIRATQTGDPRLVQLILRKGADVQAVDADGHNAHDVALQLGFLSIAEAIRFAWQESK